MLVLNFGEPEELIFEFQVYSLSTIFKTIWI